jgi:hypothetical protein
MPSSQQSSFPRFRFGLKTILLFTTALGIYIFAYRALMQPMITVDVMHLGMVIEGSREPHYGSLEGNGGFNRFCRIVFAPIEYIDYLCRPKYWDEFSDWPE